MYCPGCATQNAENTKFCRACGANLEAVSIALSGRQYPGKPKKGEAGNEKTPKSWAQKRSEGARDAVQGAVLLTTAVLIGVAFAVFTNLPDWLVLWTVFFGWLAGWGVIALASGLSKMQQARMMLRHTEDVIPITNPLSDADRRALPSTPASFPVSVTENTTEPLRAHQSEPKQSA